MGEIIAALFVVLFALIGGFFIGAGAGGKAVALSACQHSGAYAYAHVRGQYVCLFDDGRTTELTKRSD